MSTFFIAALVVLALYLGKRWSDANVENVQLRAQVAQLKRQLTTLQRQVNTLSTGRARPAAAEPAEGDAGELHRFSAKGLASHRRRLGLSAESFGALVGVTGQSIYKWEAGKARPRASQMTAIAELRKLGKREAQARLEKLAA